MSIAVVTDSTAYLPEGYAQQYSVRTVTLHVSVDGAEAIDESDFGPSDLASAFGRTHRVTTSGATSAELAATYLEALDAGADGIVSVHLSRRLSGTWDAARLAAREVAPDRVRVVDSRSAAMGLGFPVLAAASVAGSGADLSTVEERATSIAKSTRTLFSVQTLDYLRRGGRIGTTTALFGTALAIKPLLHVREGRIEALEKVRTNSRAMARLVEVVAATVGQGRASIAVHHMSAPERAEQLAEQLLARLPAWTECVVSEVGAVIGAHIGPGAVGVVVLPGGWTDPA